MTVINIDSFTLESGCNVVQAEHFSFMKFPENLSTQDKTWFWSNIAPGSDH